MDRGVSPGEPGWYFVPYLSALFVPVMLLISAAALAHEIAIRLAGARQILGRSEIGEAGSPTKVPDDHPRPPGAQGTPRPARPSSS